jgi:hypothetical protein
MIAGNEDAVEAYRKWVEAEYESTADQRQRNRETFIGRLASGETCMSEGHLTRRSSTMEAYTQL